MAGKPLGKERLSRDPALHMSRAELQAKAAEARARDQMASAAALAGMSGDELLAHRRAQLTARDHAEAYERLIADMDEAP